MEENILPDVYPYLYLRTSGAELFGNDYQPDLVSICLGTNDLSNGDGKKDRLPFNKENSSEIMWNSFRIFTKNIQTPKLFY
jgi:lysophospholipase L1-like esterase